MRLRLILLSTAACALALPSHGDSFGNASDATADSIEAGARVVAAGGQIALGAVAIPLAAAGAVAEGGGEAATDISKELWDVANAPLSVDERVAIAQPAPNVPRETSDETER